MTLGNVDPSETVRDLGAFLDQPLTMGNVEPSETIRDLGAFFDHAKIMANVEPSETVRDLGAFFDKPKTMKEHVSRLVKTCNFQLRRIRSIRRSLSMITAMQLVNCFVISRIDYCNSILLGLPKYQQDRLQSVLNVAARLIYGRNRYDHITNLLRNRLH